MRVPHLLSGLTHFFHPYFPSHGQGGPYDYHLTGDLKVVSTGYPGRNLSWKLEYFPAWLACAHHLLISYEVIVKFDLSWAYLVLELY